MVEPQPMSSGSPRDLRPLGVSSPSQLRERIAALPRVKLAHVPTPLEECPRLSKALGGPRVLIKRDDCTGLAFGGNKARQLEFTLGQALAQGADLIVHGAASQSNHCRQTAAAAAKLGLKTVLVLRRDHKSSLMQGNLLLDHLFGTEVRFTEATTQAEQDRVKQAVAEEFRAQGYRPYVIAGMEAAALGAIAYADCFLELGEQLRERGTKADYLVVCSSSATQAGLVLANRVLGQPLRILGVSPSFLFADIPAEMVRIAQDAARRLGFDLEASPEEVYNTVAYVGRAYGYVTPEGLEALRLMAHTEGILLDPVYTAKALAGLIDLTQRGEIEREATAVFLHTGGTPALFAYAEEILQEGRIP